MNIQQERDGGGEGGGGGYKPPKPTGAPVTTSTIDANVKKDNLENDPEAKPYDPSVKWDPEHWAGSGLPTPSPEPPVRKPIGDPMRPIGILPRRPVANPIRALPHYGQSFSARSNVAEPAGAGTFNFGGSTTEPMNPERFLGGED